MIVPRHLIQILREADGVIQACNSCVGGEVKVDRFCDYPAVGRRFPGAQLAAEEGCRSALAGVNYRHRMIGMQRDYPTRGKGTSRGFDCGEVRGAIRPLVVIVLRVKRGRGDRGCEEC